MVSDLIRKLGFQDFHALKRSMKLSKPDLDLYTSESRVFLKLLAREREIFYAKRERE